MLWVAVYSDYVREAGWKKWKDRLQTFKVDDGVNLINAAIEASFSDHLRGNFLRLQPIHTQTTDYITLWLNEQKKNK